MGFAAVHQGGHQQLGAIADAFDLELHERVRAFAQGLGGAHSLGLHQGMDVLAQFGGADADKAPGLHQPDAGRLVGGLQQPRQQLGRHLAAAEVAHVAALGDGAIDRLALLNAEGVLAHGRNSSAAARGLDGR
ncbi:hypothetical protein D9M70_286950 [compost metagenome]